MPWVLETRDAPAQTHRLLHRRHFVPRNRPDYLQMGIHRFELHIPTAARIEESSNLSARSPNALILVGIRCQSVHNRLN